VASTQRYLGARTPFGTIIHVSDCVYNPEVTVRTKDGSIKRYRLPFLIAHGLTLPGRKPMAHFLARKIETYHQLLETASAEDAQEQAEALTDDDWEQSDSPLIEVELVDSDKPRRVDMREMLYQRHVEQEGRGVANEHPEGCYWCGRSTHHSNECPEPCYC